MLLTIMVRPLFMWLNNHLVGFEVELKPDIANMVKTMSMENIRFFLVWFLVFISVSTYRDSLVNVSGHHQSKSFVAYLNIHISCSFLVQILVVEH